MARSASYLERGAEILSIGSCAAAGIDEERAGAEKEAAQPLKESFAW